MDKDDINIGLIKENNINIKEIKNLNEMPLKLSLYILLKK